MIIYIINFPKRYNAKESKPQGEVTKLPKALGEAYLCPAAPKSTFHLRESPQRCGILAWVEILDRYVCYWNSVTV